MQANKRAEISVKLEICLRNRKTTIPTIKDVIIENNITDDRKTSFDSLNLSKPLCVGLMPTSHVAKITNICSYVVYKDNLPNSSGDNILAKKGEVKKLIPLRNMLHSINHIDAFKGRESSLYLRISFVIFYLTTYL